MTVSLTYDAFISYAHNDNFKRWVETFQNDLANSLLGSTARHHNVWFDKLRVSQAEQWASAIEGAVRDSKVMLCLVSPNYLNSEVCRRERRAFIEKAEREPKGLAPNGLHRVIPVYLYPRQDLRERDFAGREGFRFYDPDLGAPLGVTTPAFEDAIWRLAGELIRQLEHLRTDSRPRLSQESLLRYRRRLVEEMNRPTDQYGKVDSPMLRGHLFDQVPQHFVSPELLELSAGGRRIRDGLDALLTRLLDPAPNNLFVVADSGVGKSSLLLRLLYTFATREAAETPTPLYLAFRDLPAGAQVDDVLKFICAVAETRYDIALDVPELIAGLRSGSLLLLLDALEERGGELRFLPSLIALTQKSVVAARKQLIDSVSDLRLRAVHESDRFSEHLPAHLSLFEILPFDAERRKLYCMRRGASAELAEKLESGDYPALTYSTLALRFAVDRPDLVLENAGLVDLYSQFLERLLTPYLHSAPGKIREFERHLMELAADCNAREMHTFLDSSDAVMRIPSDQRRYVLECPLLIREQGRCGFTHDSWLAFLTARFLGERIEFGEVERIAPLRIDRSVSRFVRDRLTRRHAAWLANKLGALTRSGTQPAPHLLFNLAHVFQAFFLRQGVEGFKSLEDRRKLDGWLELLSSSGDIIAEGYAARVRAQLQGPLLMFEHVEKVRSSREFTERNVEVFVTYNRGHDGFLSQMARHLQDQETYEYCLLLDLLMIEVIASTLSAGSISTLETPLKTALAHHKDPNVRAPINDVLELVRARLASERVAGKLAKTLDECAALARERQAVAQAGAEAAEEPAGDPETVNAQAHTFVEVQIQERILDAVLEECPQFDVIAEEPTEQANRAAKSGAAGTLIVDPIDFTRDYLRGSHRYAITATLAVRGEPVLAIVEFPGKKEQWFAKRNQGIQLCGGSSAPLDFPTWSRSKVLIANQAAAERVRAIEARGTWSFSAMKFTLEDLFACLRGENAALILADIKAHDVAAATLFALEAGLAATDWRGEPLRFDRTRLSSGLCVPNGILIARREPHRTLLREIAR
jgi:fructose-1,6-bisphosphatase/inositol monophosphatase family enzyme